MFIFFYPVQLRNLRKPKESVLFESTNGLNAGNITLTDYWENYDRLCVIGSSDNYDFFARTYLNKEDILYDISKGKKTILSVHLNYWLCRFTKGSKTIITTDENSKIHKIIGIKYL